jgi:hypothetical protein
MKSRILLASLVVIALASCHKDKGIGTLPAGTWNVVSDSTYAGIGPIASPKVYVGQPGDYFKFSGNTLSIKEGTFRVGTATYTQVQDTLKLTYSHLEDNGEVIDGTGTAKYIITSQTATSMKLTAAPLLTPGGVFEEFITLSR